MTIKTKNVGFLQFARGDNERDYLEKWLALSLRSTDGLFDPVTGHNHNGSGTNGPGVVFTSGLVISGATPATGAGQLGLGFSFANVGGGAAATLGTIGGAGPTTAGMNQWLQISAGGTPYFVPIWR